MIFKRRFCAALLFLVCGAFATEDFKFDADDLQVVYSDPSETVIKSPSRYLYAKEVAQCPNGESKTILTLLLQTLKWSDVSERKKEKAIKKLSRFFLVPRQFITVSDIHTPEILEMLKHSINKSNNLLNTKESVARIEFMIGCGDKMFENGKSLAQHINEYIKTGALDELSGLPIDWWNIWAKHVKSRVQRTRRQALDGSGNGEEDEEYIYDDEEDEEADSDTNDESTEAPRVRHNQRKKNSSKKTKKQKKVFVAQIQDEPSLNTEEGIREMIPEMVPEEVPMLPAEIPEQEVEPITQRSVNLDRPITPIDVSENIKLESYVNKTIVNDNNVVDVPVYEEKDKMLEEVRKMISEPPVDPSTPESTISIETTTPQHVPETTTESATIKFEEVTAATSVATTAAAETETIFVPVNAQHNENINTFDEKFSVLTTSEPLRLEDEVTEPSPHVHETTHIYITTLPPTPSTELTTSPDPPTSTLRIVDATLAVEQATTEIEAEGKANSQAKNKQERKKQVEESESNYDDEYDDTLPEEDAKNADVEATSSTRAPTTAQRRPTTAEATTPQTVPTTTEQEEESLAPTQQSTLAPTVELSTEAPTMPVATDASEPLDYESNNPPRVDKRVPKTAVTSGKPFVIKVEQNVFYDEEDKTNLKLEFLDKNKQPIPSTSWIRFDPSKREIYGLPLESDVSRYEFKLRATDSEGEFVEENIDITVQQYKGHRSVNHEIYIQVKLDKIYESPVDWEIRLIRGLVEALDDGSTSSVVVREIRPNKYDPSMFTFVYTNETLTKDHCPRDELEELMNRLTKPALNEAMKREIVVRNIEKDLVGSCQERVQPKIPIAPTNTKNFPPTVRNPVDQIKAYVGQLLVFEVPKDTFYDPEDFTELKLTLLNGDRSPLEPGHWLQFDAKNHEFYGVPTPHDKTQQYILVAEDKQGLLTNDALMVEVLQGNYKRDLGALFDYQLDIPLEQFQNAATKRKFIEGVARVFQDADTSHILLKVVKKLQYAGRTSVIVQNKTLYRENRECPSSEIDKLRQVLLRQDRSVRDEVKATIGNDFNVLKITVSPYGNCAGGDVFHHPEEITTRPEDAETPIINQDVLITYVLPTAIILLMLLIALLIACLLYKRRNTGKMELGDEEERKSFRSKGIPVIFQDELEEKPEIVTKSPIILKDEKPPLLPQYNGLNQDGDDDNMDQYIPPQPLMMGSRESRGKSPVTPSYRKPPPYVSP